MSIHEVLSNSQNDASASAGNRPNPNQRASYLHCQRTGDTMINRGASGAMTQDQAFATHGLSVCPPDAKVWLVDLLTNDMRLRPQNAAGQQWIKDFMTACIVGRLFLNKKTARAGAASSSGTWANTQVDNFGMYATSSGAKKTFNASGKAIAVCWFADYNSASQGVFEIRIDGTLRDTVNIYIPYGNTYNGLRYGPAARVYDCGPGSHTVEVKCVSNGTNAYLSYVAGIDGQTTPKKLFVGTGSKCAGVPDSFSASCRQMVIDHVTYLSGLGFAVKVLDTWSALDPALHFMPDAIHWNAAGESVVEQLMCAAEREPQTLTYPTEWGTTMTIHINIDGIITSYEET